MSHGLPNPPVEVPVVRSIVDLAPKFADKVQRVLTRMIDGGHDSTVAESLRSDARQGYLWGFGRDYDDGRGVVTNAETASKTWHHYGLAVDIISQSKQWDAPAAFWEALGAAALAEGLTWGGTWRQKDLPHVQWGPPMRATPSDTAIELLASGGAPAVWAEVGAA